MLLVLKRIAMCKFIIGGTQEITGNIHLSYNCNT